MARLPPSRRKLTIFVMLGAGFHEGVAALWVTELRAGGWRVRIVGLQGIQINGVHGIRLLADMVLEEALATVKGVIGLIIPCDVGTWQRSRQDPRVDELLQHVANQDAKFIVGQGDQSSTLDWAEAGLPENCFVCPPRQELWGFVQEVMGLL